MKKIFAGIVLPTLAALAVIGSGFSVYFFGENQDKISSNGTVKVENLVRIGDLTTSVSSADLHLDQTKAVRSAILGSDKYVNAATNGNVDGKSNYDSAAYGAKAVAKGLYLTSNDTGSTTASKFEIKYNKNSADQFVDYIDGAAKLQIVTTFTFSDGVENYVGMKYDTSDKNWAHKDGTGVYTYTWATEDVANKDYSKTISYGDGETNNTAYFQFVYLAYNNQYNDITGKDEQRGTASETATMKTAEPHTDAEYSAMLKDVKSGKLTIETVATIIVPTTGA